MTSEFEVREYLLGYVITFRSYGIWLHGDRRGSVNRFHNRHGNPTAATKAIEEAIRETCKKRQWDFWTEADVIKAVAYVDYDQGEFLD